MSTHLTDYLQRVSFRRYRTLNVFLNCEVGPKKWFWGPRFVGGRDIPDFGHAFSNYTYFRPCGRIWLSSVQRAQRLGGEKKKESLVKHIVRRHTMSGDLNQYLYDDDTQLFFSFYHTNFDSSITYLQNAIEHYTSRMTVNLLSLCSAKTQLISPHW